LCDHTGSAIAFGKLNGNLSSKPWALPKRNVVNGLTLALNAWCRRMAKQKWLRCIERLLGRLPS